MTHLCDRCRKATMTVRQVSLIRHDASQVHSFLSVNLCKACRSKMVDRCCEFVDEITHKADQPNVEPLLNALADAALECDEELDAAIQEDMERMRRVADQPPAAPVMAEVERATLKFPTWPTDPLHAVAVLGEEFGELTKAVLQLTYEPHKTTADEVRTEAIQTAAMALRFVASLDRYEYRRGDQHAQDAASQPTARCRYCGVPDGDGHTADCQHPSLASQPTVSACLGGAPHWWDINFDTGATECRLCHKPRAADNSPASPEPADRP